MLNALLFYKYWMQQLIQKIINGLKSWQHFPPSLVLELISARVIKHFDRTGRYFIHGLLVLLLQQLELFSKVPTQPPPCQEPLPLPVVSSPPHACAPPLSLRCTHFSPVIKLDLVQQCPHQGWLSAQALATLPSPGFQGSS